MIWIFSFIRKISLFFLLSSHRDCTAHISSSSTVKNLKAVLSFQTYFTRKDFHSLFFCTRKKVIFARFFWLFYTQSRWEKKGKKCEAEAEKREENYTFLYCSTHKVVLFSHTKTTLEVFSSLLLCCCYNFLEMMILFFLMGK